MSQASLKHSNVYIYIYMIIISLITNILHSLKVYIPSLNYILYFILLLRPYIDHHIFEVDRSTYKN